ncbi:MAG: type IV secretory system conjugative DNA transfer family protein, partial [Planctomycetota bacterium]
MSQALATAEWADPDSFAKQHAYAPGKFWLGRSPVNGEPLGYADDRHVCLVSGSRSGKGTTSIVPNLCLWPGSVVVVDPKGENATVTAARRGPGSDDCEGMGQAVHVLDPFGAAKIDDTLRSRFNPLDTLDPKDPRSIDEAGRIADAIVVINPETKDPFWDQSARSLVKGLILHVLTDPMFGGRRNLNTLRQLIARGDHEGVAMLREAGEEEVASAQALLWQGVSVNEAFNGVIAGIGENMANMAVNSAKQFESVLQVANRNTEFLDSPGMQDCVAESDFKLSDLKTDSKGVSVYLSLPQRYMGEHFRWLRMMITLILNEMEATPGQPSAGHRVLMCLDEFAGLKRMEVIENAVAQIAGSGVKLFFVLQSLEQLKATYKDNWETFLSNAGLKLFFGLDDHFSREYVSKFIGDTELMRELETANQTISSQTTLNTGTSSSKSWNNQKSTGQSTSDNWKSMPFFLRNTAGMFAAITGKRQATRNQNTSTAESDGGSSGETNSTATSDSSATATGSNQSLHKRALVTPDEVGRFFGRIVLVVDPAE